MRIVRVIAVVLSALLLLVVVGAAGYAIGVNNAPRAVPPVSAPTSTPDPCAAQAAAYANAGNSSNSGVFALARADFQACRQRYP